MSDATYVNVRAISGQGMVTLRADLSAAKIKSAVKSVVGEAVPAQTRINSAGGRGIAWMSPDEALILVPHGDATQAVQDLEKALKAQHHLAVDVSDARAMFQLEGDKVREVLAKLVPVDTHPDALKVGDFRRTRFGQIAGAFWFKDETTVAIICFRSVAHYMHLMLQDAAKVGSEVA